MKQFKAGDRVVRVGSTEFCADNDFMRVGNEYVVRKHNQGCLYLEGSNFEYKDEAFKLAEEKPTFKAMKFKVTSPEQSKEIQEALFSMGYVWGVRSKRN